MIRDILDIFNARPHFNMKGKYYEERPSAFNAESKEFNYEYVDPNTVKWKKLFGNIQGGVVETVVRTYEPYNFTAGKGVVVLQDRTAYLIEQKLTDVQTVSKQTYRVTPFSFGKETILQLVAIEEPWGIL